MISVIVVLNRYMQLTHAHSTGENDDDVLFVLQQMNNINYKTVTIGMFYTDQANSALLQKVKTHRE